MTAIQEMDHADQTRGNFQNGPTNDREIRSLTNCLTITWTIRRIK